MGGSRLSQCNTLNFQEAICCDLNSLKTSMVVPAASKCRLRKVASVSFQENILFDSFSGKSWLQISCLHWGLDMRVCGLLILSASPVMDLPVTQRVPCLSPCNSWDQPSVIPLDKHLHKTGWMDLYSVCSTKGYNKIFMKPIYQLNSLSLVFFSYCVGILIFKNGFMINLCTEP